MKLCGVCLDDIEANGARWATNTVPVRDSEGEKYDLHLCKRHHVAYRTLLMRLVEAQRRSSEPETFIAVVDDGSQGPRMLRPGELQ